MTEILNLRRQKVLKFQQTIINILEELARDALDSKLIEFAGELGLDLENQDWQFDGRTNEFSLVVPDPKPAIPKGGKKK